MNTACPPKRLIDRHFAGRLRQSSERKLRAHLPECADCRQYYDRHLMLESLDPEALGARERLARGLGLRRGAGAHTRPAALAAALGAAAFAALVLLGRGKGAPAADEFTARGGARPAVAAASISIYQITPGQAPAPVAGPIAADDELAFAYRNPAGREHLLIFGVDEHDHVYWYHPDWTDSAANPAAIPIAKTAIPLELPAAISHSLDGRVLDIHAVFSDVPLTVREVEALLAAGRFPPRNTDHHHEVLSIRR